MDVSSFFDYPVPQAEKRAAAGFLDQADERDWDLLLGAMQTVLLRAREAVFAEGQADRALYMLTDGRLEVSAAGAAPMIIAAPPAEIVNEIAFLDGGPCAITAQAITDARVLRLSFDTFEALAAREPQLGRRMILDLGRILAQRLRHGSGA
jgi:CRP/FNR family transcriptional regulator, cyclic AMP receptor protein